MLHLKTKHTSHFNMTKKFRLYFFSCFFVAFFFSRLTNLPPDLLMLSGNLDHKSEAGERRPNTCLLKANN